MLRFSHSLVVILILGPSTGIAAAFDDILYDDGQVMLGVNDEGHLNVPGTNGCINSTPYLGLRLVGPEYEGIACGGLYEGWGACDVLTGTSGWANEAWGGSGGLSVVSFGSDGREACSVVDIGGVMEVTHHFTPENGVLYRCDVLVENTSNTPIHVHYRRVVDWSPWDFANNYVTIAGSTAHPEIVYANDNGFANPDPCTSLPPLLFAEWDFDKSGPADSGCFFHLDFGVVQPEEIVQFQLYYGCAYGDAENILVGALDSVGADAYSLGNIFITGQPACFCFGLGGLDQDDYDSFVPCLPPDEPLDLLGTFADYVLENEGAHDVACYRVCDFGPSGAPFPEANGGFVFVTDPAAQRIIRHRFDGLSNSSTMWMDSSSSPFWTGPFGIAVNDLPGHPNRDQVYVTDHDGSGFGLLKVYDISGCHSVDLVVDISGIYPKNFAEPVGVAVDSKGDVYVADRGRGVVLQFPASEFEFISPCMSVSAEILPSAVYDVSDDGFPSPIDVSVDVAGRVHVVYEKINSIAGVVVYDANGPTPGPVNPPRAHGVDAKLPLADTLYSAANTLDHLYWQDLTAGTWILHDSLFDAQWTDWRNGLETQTYWNFEITSFGSPRPTRCRERIFSAGLLETAVWGRDFLSTPHPSDLALWLPFDKLGFPYHANIAHGNKPGIPYGNPRPEIAEGMVRCSLSFPSSESSVRIATYDEIEIGEAFTFEGWIRAEPNPGLQVFADKRNGIGIGYALFLEDGRVGVELFDGSNSQSFVPTSSLNFAGDGRWHHVAIIIDPLCERVTILVDGATDQSMSELLAVPGDLTSGSPLILGAAAPWMNQPGLIGNLDECTIYEAAVDPELCRAIACAYCAGKHRPGF